MSFYYHWVTFLGVFGVLSLSLLATKHRLATVRVAVLVECLLLSAFASYNGFFYTWLPFPDAPIECKAMILLNYFALYFLPMLAVAVLYSAILAKYGAKTEEIQHITLSVAAFGVLPLSLNVIVAYISPNEPEQCKTPLVPYVNASICLWFLIALMWFGVCVYDEEKEEEERLKAAATL